MLPEKSRSPVLLIARSGPSPGPAVARRRRPESGSYVMASQTAAPPASHQRSPAQVLAAISSDLFSYPLAGSPGVVAMRHTCLPVAASKADTEPPTELSEPLVPMYTRPPPTRGAPVIPVIVESRQAGVSHTGFPVAASRAIIRQSPVPKNTFPSHTATP